MKQFRTSQTTNIADPRVKAVMMRETIELLKTRPELGFVLVSLIASFIDGLAKAAPGQTRQGYVRYLEQHFPDLCRAVGAEVFYSNVRCAAIHEFAPRPPFALAPDSELRGSYAETRNDENGAQWIFLNADLVVRDFLRHLEKTVPAGS